MLIQPIDYCLLVWFILAAAPTAYVAWDQFGRGNPEPAVMKWGFILVTLFKRPHTKGHGGKNDICGYFGRRVVIHATLNIDMRSP
jgi:hypothetical protein